MILTPLAPKRKADSIAFFIARRKETRRSSWPAIDSATSCASSSGRWISWMLMWTSRPISFCRSSRSLSTSAPRRPMMMPGREV